MNRRRGSARQRRTEKQVSIASFSRRPLCIAVAACLGAWWARPAWANPSGGVVVAGEASISQAPGVTTIDQVTGRAIINWRKFGIDPGELTQFQQPGKDAIALNRVLGKDPSKILGQLKANGNVWLINQNGVLVGPGAKVDVNGFIATTTDIEDEDFMAGRYRFTKPSPNPKASVVNEGTITIGEHGLAGLVAPHARNDGVIQGRLGKVVIAGAETYTLDFYGDGLIQFEATSKVSEKPDPDRALAENNGTINVDGGTVLITASAAAEVVDDVINVGGVVEAKSFAMQDGTIVLDGGDAGIVKVAGKLETSGVKPSAPGGAIKVSGERVITSAEIVSTGADAPGGEIHIKGQRWVGLGGTVDASGASGGRISVEAGGLSLAEPVLARGSSGAGGEVELRTATTSMETSTALVDVSGTEGGRISHIAGQQITTSGTYRAVGTAGKGGQIDLTAPATKLLSTQFDASGEMGGGQVRLGGEYQGGKELEVDELPNAQTLVTTDATTIKADALGADGDGGRVIVWSDQRSVYLGNTSAVPGNDTGEGGFVEISSADSLTFAGTAVSGVGDRNGTILLDPKNITIAEIDEVSQISLILGFNYTDIPDLSAGLEPGDEFGRSVSLEGTRLAVGAPFDEGFGNSEPFGAVYLFSFADEAFSGGVLESVIGSGYSGGKNVDISALANGGEGGFGQAVSLTGDRLAVGNPFDNGASGLTISTGAVYLFSFDDTAFNGGNLEAIIGVGYDGPKDINLSEQLDNEDGFGDGVSLDGDWLAVGAPADDGASDTRNATGAAYLFSFDDTAFNGGTVEAVIGVGYDGTKDIDLSDRLDDLDEFGGDVSLDGSRLAVGAPFDGGANNSGFRIGAAYLFTFQDADFNGGALEAVIGAGYSDPKDIDLSSRLNDRDEFGWGVSLDGPRLAVGAPLDDGASNEPDNNQGAAYLIAFDDAVFNGGNLEAIVGVGYGELKDIDLSNQLDATDFFGTSVSLDGNRLAVGAFLDDGVTDNSTDAGAVYLLTFTDDQFNGGQLEGIIGSGYTGTKDIDLSAPEPLGDFDQFGAGVSLDGTRLAIGAWADDGAGNLTEDAGAVYLISFDDLAFNGAVLEAILGEGYTGGKNVDLSAVLDGGEGGGDFFGASVSLDGNRLAVGAPLDDGAGNSRFDAGAAYLFSFADDTFTGGTLEATIGAGYTGPQDVDLGATLLDDQDRFGWSVSVDGRRLAVGANSDDSFNNDACEGTVCNYGAVHLFTFANDTFSDGLLEATLGFGYSGGKNLNLDQVLDEADNFGIAVSLDGLQLAVGASLDDGLGAFGDTDYGAVHLFTFDDANFGGASLAGTIGVGYTGPGDIDMSGTLDSADRFGWGVSLEQDRLAAGARFDDGAGNLNCGDAICDFGAVHLFRFGGPQFAAGLLDGTIGVGYTGTGDLDMTQFLDPQDAFGQSVSLDAGRLAVGAPLDDGLGDVAVDTGAAYLFTLAEGADNIAGATFSNDPDADYTISPTDLEALLGNSQDVVLQANNDITVQDPVLVDGGEGGGGSLTLEAGRSVLINADIATDDGDLTVFANQTLAAGALDEFRDPGDAVLAMADGTTVDAGLGSIVLTLQSDPTKADNSTGDITVSSLVAQDLVINNFGEGNVNQTDGSSLSVSGLLLAGSGAFVLDRGNDIDVLATDSGPTAVRFHDIDGMSVGTVLDVAGLTLQGDLELDVEGDLTLDAPIIAAGFVDLATASEEFFSDIVINSTIFSDGDVNIHAEGDVFLATTGSITSTNGAVNVSTNLDDFNFNNITLNGPITASGSNDSGFGVDLEAGDTISIGNDIAADNGLSARANAGIFIGNGADITTTGGSVDLDANIDGGEGGGSIEITGASIATNGGDIQANGTGDSFNPTGILISDSTIDAGGGNIQLRAAEEGNRIRIDGGEGGFNDDSEFVDALGQSSVRTTGTGGITFTADEIDLLDSTEVSGSGILTMQPLTDSLGITVGGDTDNTDLNLTSVDLGALQDGFERIVIGHETGSGAISVEPAGATFNDSLTLRSPEAGGSIVVDGPLQLNTNDLFLNAGSLADVNAQVTAGNIDVITGDLTVDAPVNASGSLIALASGIVSIDDSVTTENGPIEITSDQGFSNNGRIEAQRNSILVSSPSFDIGAEIVSGSVDAANSAIRLETGGPLLFADGDVDEVVAVIGQVEVDFLTTNRLRFEAGDGIDFQTATDFTRFGETVFAVAGDITQQAGAPISANDVGLVSRVEQGEAGFLFLGGDVTLGEENRIAALAIGGDGTAPGALDEQGLPPFQTVDFRNAQNLRVGAVNPTGVTADQVTMSVEGALVLEEPIVAVGTGNTIVLDLDGFTNDAGTNALDPGQGRYLVHSTNDPSGDAINLPTDEFTRLYNWVFDLNEPDAGVPSEGNFFLYDFNAILRIVANDASREYGDPNPPFTYTAQGLVEGDTLLGGALSQELVLTTTATESSPVSGSPYPIVVSRDGLTSPQNYRIVTVDGELTITPAPLTASVNDASKLYGDPNPAFSANFDGFKLDQDASVLGEITFSTEAALDSPVANSPYPISLTGFENTNYVVIFATDGALTIQPAPLTATIAGVTREYGEVNSDFDAAFEGFKLDEDESVLGDILFETPADPSSPVADSPYPITITGFDNTNYVLVDEATGELIVLPASLTIRADDVARDVGEPNPPFSASYDGFKLDEDESVVSGLDFATEAGEFSRPGAYDIEPFGASAANYIISYIDGILTVELGSLEDIVSDEVLGNPLKPDVPVADTYSYFFLWPLLTDDLGGLVTVLTIDQSLGSSVPIVLTDERGTVIAVPAVSQAPINTDLLYASDGNRELWGPPAGKIGSGE